MTRKTRRILLGLAVTAFLIIGFILLMYARGYRWDFNNNRLLLSGAIYIKPQSPKETDIFINKKNTDEQTAALIKNLLPLRKYHAQVAKVGYQTWQKEFEVTPGLVTEAENIILFPEKFSFQMFVSEPGLLDFNISPDQKFAAVKTNSAKLIFYDFSNSTTTATPFTFPDKIKTKSLRFLENDRGWSANSQKFIFSRSTAAKTTWYVWDKSAKKLTDLTLLYERKIIVKQPSASPLPTKFNPSKVLWFGGDDNLLILMDSKLFQLDLADETVADLNLSDVVDFDSRENKIIALKNPDILLIMDSAVANVSVLGQTTFAPQKIFIAPDDAKIAYTTANALGVMWLKDTGKQPLKKSGDQEVIYQSLGDISSVYWHTKNEHLMFLENQNLKVVELDTRDKINLASWPETITAINYLTGDAKLYFLTDGALKLAEGEF
ncbi:MAG: hypothetical protein HY452_00410 [Parcubacteria group bacterium]|nr:hypothetical protein [Parcubacteria group bacterium]